VRSLEVNPVTVSLNVSEKDIEFTFEFTGEATNEDAPVVG
jgi:hypothetical protein